MTDLRVARSALELNGIVAAKPELAGPLLKFLKAAGGDMVKLQKLTVAALAAAKEALPPVATTVSVLEQFKFKIRPDGAREFIVPKGMSVIQAFEILNIEAARLEIKPAVHAPDFDWYKQNTSAGTVDYEKDTTGTLIPFVKGSIGKDRNYMQWRRGALIDEGHIALANALEWVISAGSVDSFEREWVRGKVPGFALYRCDHGVCVIRLGANADARVFVGLSSGPKE